MAARAQRRERARFSYFLRSPESIHSHCGGINALSLSGDGATLYTASRDATVRARTLRPPANLLSPCSLGGALPPRRLVRNKHACVRRSPHAARPRTRAALPRRRLTASSPPPPFPPRQVRAWGIRSAKPTARAVLEGHTDWVTAVSALEGHGAVVTASCDCTVRLWRDRAEGSAQAVAVLQASLPAPCAGARLAHLHPPTTAGPPSPSPPLTWPHHSPGPPAQGHRDYVTSVATVRGSSQFATGCARAAPRGLLSPLRSAAPPRDAA